LGQPSDTKPTFGVAGVDMALTSGVYGWMLGAWRASDQKVRKSSGDAGN